MFPIFSPSEAPPPNKPAESYPVFVLVRQPKGEAPKIGPDLAKTLLSEAIESLPESARENKALLDALSPKRAGPPPMANGAGGATTSAQESPRAVFAKVLHENAPIPRSAPNPNRVFMEGPLPIPSSLENAIHQTWDWPQAENVARQATLAYRIEHKNPELDRHSRLQAIRAVLTSLFSYFNSTQTEVLALYWEPAERLVDPDAYLESVAHEAAVGDYALNVHLYRLKENDDHLMETRGLSHFGLPDLQICFSEYEPGEVAQLLLSYGEYLYENGDVIKHEDEVRGVNEDQVWTCKRGHSYTVPAREAIELKHRPEEAEHTA